MSNRFVSGGTISSSGDVSKADDVVAQQPPPAKKNPEWEAVQQELEAERRRREEARQKAAEGGESSLYDILQANKAAKQAEFEEKHKLKNQFRALDDDEAAFLDEVKERVRLQEEKVREETEQGLRAFRERQKVGGTGASEAQLGDDDPQPLGQPDEHQIPEDEWSVTRKRKKSARDKDVKRLKRRSSSGGGGGGGGVGSKTPVDADEESKGAEATEAQSKGQTVSPPVKRAAKSESDGKQPKGNKASLLVSYGSDDSDEE